MARGDEKAPAGAKKLTLRDFTAPPTDDRLAEYQRVLAVNYGWQEGVTERRNSESGQLEPHEFGAPHEHIAKTLLGVALRDLRSGLSNQKLNEARDKITKAIADEIPEP